MSAPQENAALAETRRRFREVLATARATRTVPPRSPPPRYDAVYLAGVRWLDGQANEEQPEA